MAVTRLGLYGGSRGPYGSFGGKSLLSVSTAVRIMAEDRQRLITAEPRHRRLFAELRPRHIKVEKPS